MTGRIDDLVLAVCGSASHPLAALLRTWCLGSRLVTDFFDTYTPKIRKKVRLAGDADELADLLAELATAAWLVRDRRFSVAYESAVANAQRAPDFQIRFRTNALLYVEVTRPRLRIDDAGNAARVALKLARVMGEKIDQFPPGAMNVLVAAVPPGTESGTLVPAAVKLLESQRVQDDRTRSHDLREDNIKHFLRLRGRLSAVALVAYSSQWQPENIHLWQNPQARHPLLPEIARYLAQGGAGEQ